MRSFVALAGPGLTGIVNNTATVTATTSDPNPANNSASTSSSTSAQADLSLTKSTSASPIAGQDITYTLTATNSGPSNATGTVITDTLPAGITFTSGTFAGGTCTHTGQVVTCAIGTLAPNSTVTATITAAVDAGVSGPSTNTATVTSPITDPTPGNRDASSTTTIGTLADVGVVLTPVPAPETVNAGETADYNIKVTNTGPSVARGVIVTGHLPPGLTPVLGSSHGACTVSGNTITCALGDLDPGAVLNIPLEATVLSSTPAGIIPGTATVGSATPDSNQANNTSTADITVVAKAPISISKVVDPSPLVAGAAATYVITATNAGPSDAHQVVITDTLDARLAVGTASPNVGTCAVAGQTVTCSAPTVPANSKLVVRITVAVDHGATGSVGNDASVTSATPPTDSTPSTVHIDTPVTQRANLLLTKTATPEPVSAGNAVTYTLIASNNGPSDAANVTLSDPMPAGLLVLSGFIGVTFSDGTCTVNATSTAVNCDFGTLAAGQSRTVVIEALVPAVTAAGTSLVNTATLASPTPDTVPGNRIATVTSTVVTSADLTLSKAPVTDPVEAGRNQTYVISVNNNGPSAGRGVVVSDPLPAGLTYISAITSVGVCAYAAGTVTCSLGDVLPGASPTIQITARLDPGIGGTRLTNTATIASAPTTGSPTADPDPSNNSSSASQNVAARSDLTMLKTRTSGAVVAGGTVSYLLTATNTGPSNANNFTVSDPIPQVPTGTALVSAQPSGDGSCSTVKVLQPDAVTLVPTLVCTWSAGARQRRPHRGGEPWDSRYGGAE